MALRSIPSGYLSAFAGHYAIAWPCAAPLFICRVCGIGIPGLMHRRPFRQAAARLHRVRQRRLACYFIALRVYNSRPAGHIRRFNRRPGQAGIHRRQLRLYLLPHPASGCHHLPRRQALLRIATFRRFGTQNALIFNLFIPILFRASQALSRQAAGCAGFAFARYHYYYFAAITRYGFIMLGLAPPPGPGPPFRQFRYSGQAAFFSAIYSMFV